MRSIEKSYHVCIGKLDVYSQELHIQAQLYSYSIRNGAVYAAQNFSGGKLW